MSFAARLARSIPACAGEPPYRASCRPSGRVYPRVCGGTWRSRRARRSAAGLSPRVRGNPGTGIPPGRLLRSIPACAGEPHRSAGRLGRCEVYPRVCGGTPGVLAARRVNAGLSPRVRGNLDGRSARRYDPGSIPACAGEPSMSVIVIPLKAVYPRVCGGTAAGRFDGIGLRGLSPRVRGNRSSASVRADAQRSIPACAGEPGMLKRRRNGLPVYPRVCGGTRKVTIWSAVIEGLSPRVRGNRWSKHPAYNRARSIPACAGEPSPCRPDTEHPAVYPRVCGGTGTSQRTVDRAVGLSPRVRGNHHAGLGTRHRCGSIPACAGEPRAYHAGLGTRQVYPRVCGGTPPCPGRCW